MREMLLMIALAGLLATWMGPQPAVAQTWTVFAGTGQADSPVATQPMAPTEAALRNVYGIEVTDRAIYFSTVDDHSIWKSDRAGTRIVRIAGTGQSGYSGDGGPATEATFNAPHEIRVDAAGNVYVADTGNHCIRRIDGRTGIVGTLAGDGQPGFHGDGGPGVEARFNRPHSLVLDGRGGVLVADTKNHRLRRIDLARGTVSTVAGDGRRALPQAGQRLAEVSLFGPRSLAAGEQAIWLVLREGNSVWRIDRKTNVIRRVAGTGETGHEGDGGDPRQATFRGPKGIAVDSRGNLVIVDTENHAVRYVDRSGNTIRTLEIPFQMKRPHGAAVMRLGDRDVFLVSDSENHRVLAGR